MVNRHQLFLIHDFIMFLTYYESKISEVSNGKQMSVISYS